MDTAGRAGFLAKHVVVYSNDPVQPMVSLTVLMRVEQKTAPAAAPQPPPAAGTR